MSQGSYENGIGRRDILCSGGSVVFSSLITALLGDAKPARAQTISGSVPAVDRAAIRVVVDNYHFALSPSGKIGDVEVERIGFPLSDKPPGKVLMSEFGLSMHLETRRGNETRNVLIDFGYSAPTLLNNLDILGIDPAKLDAMVLSHGHYDHFGGNGWIPQCDPGTVQAEAAAVYRRRGMLLFTSVHCRADAARRFTQISADHSLPFQRSVQPRRSSLEPRTSGTRVFLRAQQPHCAHRENSADQVLRSLPST
jgi:Metallo-beta-lactamase superfamily